MATILAGCMPLKQYDAKSNSGDIAVCYIDEGLLPIAECLLLQIGPSNVSNKYVIIDSESYVMDSKNRRYGVKTQKHPFDIKRSFPNVRDRLYLTDENGKVIKKWRNGNWQIVICTTNDNGKEVRTVDLKLWTFFYNPIIHGPPN